MSEHTPTPWAKRHEKTDYRIVDANGRTVARVPMVGTIGWNSSETVDTICASVNSHDAMRAALEALPLDREFTDAADFVDNSEHFRKAMKLARAALALAEKGTKE